MVTSVEHAIKMYYRSHYKNCISVRLPHLGDNTTTASAAGLVILNYTGLPWRKTPGLGGPNGGATPLTILQIRPFLKRIPHTERTSHVLF